MTLTLTPIVHDNLCHGSEWTVTDIDILAERVARVALGQYRHIAQILEGLTVDPPSTTKDHATNALEKLRLTANGDPWHRDGWLFQVISWVAASQQKKGAALKPPHPFHAHKGFDGLQIELTDDGTSVKAVIIFEDKATDRPRETIHGDVFPDIVNLEAGGRVSELTSEVTTMLEAQQRAYPALDIDSAIDKLLWQEARQYRISITIDDTHKGDAKRKGLFKDFDKKAPGDLIKRRAETMHFENLRQWMDGFAERVATHINNLASS